LPLYAGKPVALCLDQEIKRMIHKRFAASAFIAGLSLLGAAAHADVRYTTVMSMGSGEGAGFSSELTYFVKGARERSETSMKIGPMSMKTVSITQCDSDQEIKLDADSKIYTAQSIGAGVSSLIPSMPMGGMGRGRGRANTNETPGTGTTDVSMTSKDLGKEKVGNFDTHHYMLTIHTKTTGCAGNADTDMKMEMWVAPGQLGRLDCPKRFQSSTPGAINTDGSPCKLTTHFSGDMSSMRDLFAHLIVKQIIYMDEKPMMTMTIKDYSTAALDSSIFAVPDDFKKVSDKEFSQTQQQNMMKGFRAGANTGSSDDAPATTAPEAQPDNAAAANDTPADAPAPEQPKKKKGIKIPGFHL